MAASGSVLGIWWKYLSQKTNHPQTSFPRNHFPDTARALVLYGEKSSDEHTQLVREDHDGLDVYVRKKYFNEK